ncbi:hypothetical protein JYT11_00830 [Planctomycetaceae bacterium AH-315-I19]|nr:hypothetical protein [Planctomycetaceae bacterium AH-315-I19]
MIESLNSALIGGVCFVFLAATPVVAQPGMGSSLAEVSLESELTALVPGETNWIALRYEIEPEWHLYWKNAGDSGQPPSQKWAVPDGVSIGEPLWPVPRRHVSPGEILDYIIENELVLLYPVTLDDSVVLGDSITLRLETNFLVCKDVCLFGDGEAKLTLAVASEAGSAGNDAIFENARRQIPRPAERADELQITMQWHDESLKIFVPGASQISFFPHRGKALAEAINLLENGQRVGPVLRIPFELTENVTAVAGVLCIKRESEITYQKIRVPVQRTAQRDE